MRRFDRWCQITIAGSAAFSLVVVGFGHEIRPSAETSKVDGDLIYATGVAEGLYALDLVGD